MTANMGLFLAEDQVSKQAKGCASSTIESEKTRIDFQAKNTCPLSLKPAMDFDALSLQKETLISSCCDMFISLGLVEEFNLDMNDVRRFVLQVCLEYEFKRHNVNEPQATKTPPYHNFVHAADVTQCVFTLLNSTSAGQLLDKHSQMVLIVAALCHDMGHGGRTNAFLNVSNDPLLHCFNDDSDHSFGALVSNNDSDHCVQVGCLEQFHAALASKVLADHLGIFGILRSIGSNRHPDSRDPNDLQERFLRDVVQVILSTDLSAHKHVLAKFEASHESGAYTNADSLAKADAAVTDGSHSKSRLLRLDSPRRLLMMLVMKVSDISNVARNQFVANQWSKKLTEEWAQQSDAERSLGLPVTFNCEVDTPQSRAKSCIGFVDVVAMKCFLTLATALPDTAFLVRRTEDNKALWERRVAEGPSAHVYSERAQSVFTLERKFLSRRASCVF
jgi:hypothetical protein